MLDNFYIIQNRPIELNTHCNNTLQVDPGQVATAAQSSLLAPTPATFVSSALRTLGYSSW